MRSVLLGLAVGLTLAAAPAQAVTLGRTNALLTKPRSGAAREIAREYVSAHARRLGLTDGDVENLEQAASYTSPNGVTHITWRQTVDGIPSYDGTLTVNVAGDGAIVNATGTTHRGLRLVDTMPTLTRAKGAKLVVY